MLPLPDRAADPASGRVRLGVVEDPPRAPAGETRDSRILNCVSSFTRVFKVKLERGVNEANAYAQRPALLVRGNPVGRRSFWRHTTSFPRVGSRRSSRTCDCKPWPTAAGGVHRESLPAPPIAAGLRRTVMPQAPRPQSSPPRPAPKRRVVALRSALNVGRRLLLRRNLRADSKTSEGG